jgi:cytidylate kinase
MIIALDGPSGTGKSTTAKRVADVLKIAYLDTGAMYRTLTYFALEQHIPVDAEQALVDLAQSLEFEFLPGGLLRVNGIQIGSEIRTPNVSENVSKYCVLPLVRAALTERMRAFGLSHDCILDGRDIGTVVFPRAEYKFFMVADYRIRAERRLSELESQGVVTTLEAVEANLRERDELDASRASAPLRQADDAEIIDTTQLTIPQQVERICARVKGGAH